MCKKGSVLTPEQAKILEYLGHRLASFKLHLRAAWIKGEGFQRLDGENEAMDENSDENDN